MLITATIVHNWILYQMHSKGNLTYEVYIRDTSDLFYLEMMDNYYERPGTVADSLN